MSLEAGRELLKFAGIGVQAAVRRIFNQDDGERFLHNTLCGMPGAPAKIGQLLGMRNASEIPAPKPMPIEVIKSIIASETPALAAQIESLSEWSRTASIGQTHQATLKSGELVAIKVQYPEVAQTLGAQIDAIFGVAGYSPAKNYQFDVGGTKNFLRQKLLDETDYRIEAVTQNRFSARYSGSAIIIPKVYSEYSTSKILTQAWEDCDSVSVAKEKLTYGQCCKAAAVFSAFLLDSAFGLGLIHTDLNPGNYGFRVNGEDIQVVLYDFGSSYTLAPDQGVKIFRWLEATGRKDPAQVRVALEALGFDAKRLNPIADKLLALSEALFLPLTQEGLWSANDWHLQDKMDEILKQDKWWFRTAGPAWFLYFMRTIQGWQHAVMTLDATINLAQIWRPWDQQLRAISSFMPQGVTNHAVAVVDGVELKSKLLRVSVTEGGEEIVDLSLPARAIEDLEDLLPETVAAKCATDGIDLIAIKTKAIAAQGVPQELFSASLGQRHYRVWLA
jgi:predicted unusual protein kinase regulating ubiquinone biosynthesis (AarF/ABC1/UbiB family)